MPQLGEYKWIVDTVFFLYEDKAAALAGKNTGGTGFFLAVPSKRWPEQYFHVHGVTNWHVACRGHSAIRVSRRAGIHPDVFDFDASEWVFPAAGNDIAISPPLHLDPAIHRAEAFGIDALLSDDEEKGRDINAAEDLFMIGRFLDIDGAETNMPFFRFGNISVMDAKLRQETGFVGRSIIADMHSRTGYSGSPVFIYRTPGSVFAGEVDLAQKWKYIKLMGLLWGQFPENWEKNPDKTVRNAANVSLAKDHIVGVSGMSCVIPAQVIIDLLANQKLENYREKAELDLVACGQGKKIGLLPKSMVNTQPTSPSKVREVLEKKMRGEAMAFAYATAFGERPRSV